VTEARSCRLRRIGRILVKCAANRQAAIAQKGPLPQRQRENRELTKESLLSKEFVILNVSSFLAQINTARSHRYCSPHDPNCALLPLLFTGRG
jgi:hypothetical protein